MKSSIHEIFDSPDYFDVFIYIKPFKYIDDGEWKRCITYDAGRAEITEYDGWEFSPNDNSGFDETDRCPPVEVMREFGRRRPEMIALIMKKLLQGKFHDIPN